MVNCIYIIYMYIYRGKKAVKLSLSARSIFSYRLMLARTLRLDIEEEQCKTVLIIPPNPSNSSVTLLLSKQNRALDRIKGDGNCFFWAISKELFRNETHHKNLREIIVEYILTNSESFTQFLSNNSETIFEDCQKLAN